MKKVFKVLFLVLFFFFGLGLALASSQKKDQSQSGGENINQQSKEEEIKWPVFASQETEIDEYFSGANQLSSGKFTIVQTQAMSTDKTWAQTGETVSFSTKIKNQGTGMKHLTHLCFNQSAGVTFGCLCGPQGPNLDPGQEMEISDTTVFTLPGTYDVWLTWSQDSTNFYQPQGGQSVKVVIE
jgi:hypothetical protein